MFGYSPKTLIAISPTWLYILCEFLLEKRLFSEYLDKIQNYNRLLSIGIKYDDLNLGNK